MLWGRERKRGGGWKNTQVGGFRNSTEKMMVGGEWCVLVLRLRRESKREERDLEEFWGGYY